ncbi:lipopolysaccharide biosynthesis protein [Devosia sp. Root635]|uniref:lipopolysaccharide biosynthesis protein n=1 Tax=Devosia sp. Root635 TaxID=1736575 RepID=UPI0006F3D483|nr:hypothetical protein [Devosia sp. Root635]KRA55351.1 hypothetical protein ASD80_13145 [Devosia sp. Root635]
MANHLALFRAVITSQASAGIQTIASLAVLILLTRNTEVATFGQYAVLSGVVATFTKFAGINTFFFYRNRYPLVSYREALGILALYLPFVLICGAVVVLVAAGTNLALPFLPLVDTIDYLFLGALAMLSLLNIELARFYQSIGRNVFGIWLATAAKVAGLALLLVALAILQAPFSLRTILIVLVLAQILTISYQIARDPPFLQILSARPGRFDWRAITTGVLMIPTALFYDALTLLDRLAISAHLSYETVGHYSLASQGIMIAYTILGGSLITLFYPRLVQARQAKRADETYRIIRFGFLVGTGSCIVGGIAIAALSGLVPLVFGAQYNESVDILRMMSFLPLALFLLSALAHLSYLYEDQKLSVLAYTFGTVLCAALNYGLVAMWGTVGAIAAAYISLVTLIVLHVFILLRRLPQIRHGQPG